MTTPEIPPLILEIKKKPGIYQLTTPNNPTFMKVEVMANGEIFEIDTGDIKLPLPLSDYGWHPLIEELK